MYKEFFVHDITSTKSTTIHELNRHDLRGGQLRPDAVEGGAGGTDAGRPGRAHPQEPDPGDRAGQQAGHGKRGGGEDDPDGDAAGRGAERAPVDHQRVLRHQGDRGPRRHEEVRRDAEGRQEEEEELELTLRSF